jgi:hypothetical protein
MMIDLDAALDAHRRLSVLLPCAFHSPLRMQQAIADAAARYGTAEERILAALAEIGGEATIVDIHEETELHMDTVRKMTTRMVEHGTLIRANRANNKAFYRIRLWLD